MTMTADKPRVVRDMDGNEFVNFTDVQIGDELVFHNRNTGFGADGDDIVRTGTVTSKTDKTITVQVHDPVRVEVFERGKARTYGLTARLRAAAWYDRQVRRINR